MKHAAQNIDAGYRQDEFSALSDFVQTATLERVRPRIAPPVWPAPDAAKALTEASTALVAAYLDASVKQESLPLKEFMDDLERNILLTCLRLTHGSQRNAAALLGLKPTALFEKMRKHRINGRRIKLSERLVAVPPQEIA